MIDKTNFQKFLKHNKLTISAVEFTGSLSNNDIEPYIWDKLNKNHSSQRKIIIQYLETHLKPSLPTSIVIHDVFQSRNFLNIMTEESPFLFKTQGSTDLILAEKSYIDGLIPTSGIHCIMEFKKSVQEQHIMQVVPEIAAADFLTNDEIKTIGVLTDLNSSWHLFWLSEEKKFKTVKFSNHKKAIETIDKMVSLKCMLGLS
ncbi:29055_t:CDS:1, partial [Racocetra persica]